MWRKLFADYLLVKLKEGDESWTFPFQVSKCVSWAIKALRKQSDNFEIYTRFYLINNRSYTFKILHK